MTKLLPALFMSLGPILLINLFSTPEIFAQNFETLVINLETATLLILRITLGIVVFSDLKRNWKLIGLAIFTMILPVAGVTLFIIRDFFVNQKSKSICRPKNLIN